MPDNRHSVIGEGTDVGLIGGMAVAVWFLVLDTLAGHPFQTPSLLGQTVLLGERVPDVPDQQLRPLSPGDLRDQG